MPGWRLPEIAGEGIGAEIGAETPGTETADNEGRGMIVVVKLSHYHPLGEMPLHGMWSTNQVLDPF